MPNECPNGLLPDGPVCPGCGGRRGPSGIDGGTWVHIGEGEWARATIYGSAADRMPPMPLSPKEKQAAYRQRQAEQGLTEVRGIFLPPELHASLKAQAAKLLKKHRKEPSATKLLAGE